MVTMCLRGVGRLYQPILRARSMVVSIMVDRRANNLDNRVMAVASALAKYVLNLLLLLCLIKL